VDQKQYASRIDSTQLVDSNGGVLVDSGPGTPGSSSLEFEDSVWLPKFGISYEFFKRTKIRLAYYRSFTGYYAAGQTIEPTGFLGFPQLFAELEGSKSRNYAIGVDSYLSNEWAFGASFLDRHVEIGLSDSNSGVIDDRHTDQKIADLYLQFMPDYRIAMSFGANWDKSSTVETFSSQVALDIDRYSIPIEISFFVNNGASFKVSQTYYQQRMKSFQTAGLLKKNSWITNVSAGYRFPRHLGQLEIGLSNLFDETDEFINHDATTLAFYPGRLWFATVNINL
jgi:outer membrane receptor protein involved in Fe transport